MAQMCCMCHSLYNCKECDGCGKCEDRYDDDFDENAWECEREDAYESYLEERRTQ